ncbi:hypothetical protein K505DRAFT_363274 [Melanomma pulvis-pyrius CBS 109.77]|uniref:Uncharacterized protein n=1 Tax=Melanomma pulvis-pyrius CBS 109.77 TaxID=1314802 RepID=A0A6A6X6Y8_9PLEO|nr:hypothetical protein K505DRAFT_363274 [Melanomma pulvis-pyrius CBS 109.77]
MVFGFSYRKGPSVSTSNSSTIATATATTSSFTSTTTAISSSPFKSAPRSTAKKSNSELLAKYYDFDIGLWSGFDDDNDHDNGERTQACQVPDSPTEKSFMEDWKSDDLGYADAMVENTRGLDGVYNLRGKGHNFSREMKARPTKEKKDKETARKIKDKNVAQDAKDDTKELLFDADSTCDNAPASVVILDPIGVANQYSRLRAQDQDIENWFDCPDIPFDTFTKLDRKHAVAGASPDGPEKAFLDSDGLICESVLEYDGMCTPKVAVRVDFDPEVFNAMDVQLWAPDDRDLIINVENEAAEARMTMPHILPPKCRPKHLVLETGFRNLSVEPSTVMARRVQKWEQEHADTDEVLEREYNDEPENGEEIATALSMLLKPRIDFLPGIDHLANPTIRSVFLQESPYNAVEEFSSDDNNESIADNEDIREVIGVSLDPDMLSDINANTCPADTNKSSSSITYFDIETRQQIEYCAMAQLLEVGESQTYRQPLPITYFDIETRQQVKYCAMAQLLEIGESQTYREPLRVVNNNTQDASGKSEWPRELSSSHAGFRPTLMIQTGLETIVEETLDSSASSSSEASIEFEGRRGFVKRLAQRDAKFLDDEDESLPVDLNDGSPSSFPNTNSEIVEESFDDDTWGCGATIHVLVPDDGFFDRKQVADEGPTCGLDIPRIVIECPTDEEPKHDASPGYIVEIDRDFLFANNEDEYEFLNVFLPQPRENSSGCCERASAARAEIDVLEKEISNFILRVYSLVYDGSFRNVELICEDARWAMNVLSQTDTCSHLVLQLKIIVEILEEDQTLTSGPCKVDVDHLNWQKMLTPNENDRNNEQSDVIKSDLEQLAELTFLTCDDPYVPFSVAEAQAKFMSWNSEYGHVDPSDLDYEMLAHARTVSTKLLESQADVIRTMKGFTTMYVSRMKNGDVIEHITATRSSILEEYDPNIPSGLEDMSHGELCGSILKVYHTLRMDPKDLRGEMPLEALNILEELKEGIAVWTAYLKSDSSPSLQIEHTSYITNRFWKISFVCMKEIENAHREAVQDCEIWPFLPEMIEMEDLIWRSWINSMRESLSLVGLFEGKVHSSFLPSAKDFVLESLSWWEAQVFRKIRDIQSAHPQ